MKIGIIGTGNIAQYLLESINVNRQLDGEIISLFGRNKEVGAKLKNTYHVDFYTNFKNFMGAPMDIIVEAATIDVAVQYMKEVLDGRKDIVLSSIGAFQDTYFLEKMEETAKLHSTQIYLPSGAIGGLDLLQSANAANGLEQVTITTRKSPASLGMEQITKEEVLFEGPAREAIKRFPKNVNVALLLSIAGLGADKTMVRVIADPEIDRNTHTIEAKGDFGHMNLQIENTPMPGNPKTSYLAALSILATLQNKDRSFSIGN